MIAHRCEQCGVVCEGSFCDTACRDAWAREDRAHEFANEAAHDAAMDALDERDDNDVDVEFDDMGRD